MKIIHALLKTVIKVILIGSVVINSTFADIDVLFNDEIEMFKIGMQTKSDDELIGLADLLTGSGLTDKDLYKIVENRTKEEYENHLKNPKDNQIARNLNGLIRAYGSFGDIESQVFIVNLTTTAKSFGVRNRAKRLSAKLGWFKKRNEIMQDRSYYSDGQDLMTHRFMSLINDTDPRMRRWATEEIDRRGGTEDIAYNTMAEILKKEGKNIVSDIHLDSLAWYCKILAKYSKDKHKELLLSIQSDKEYHKKLRKYARF